MWSKGLICEDVICHLRISPTHPHVLDYYSRCHELLNIFFHDGVSVCEGGGGEGGERVSCPHSLIPELLIDMFFTITCSAETHSILSPSM